MWTQPRFCDSRRPNHRSSLVLLTSFLEAGGRRLLTTEERLISRCITSGSQLPPSDSYIPPSILSHLMGCAVAPRTAAPHSLAPCMRTLPGQCEAGFPTTTRRVRLRCRMSLFHQASSSGVCEHFLFSPCAAKTWLAVGATSRFSCVNVLSLRPRGSRHRPLFYAYPRVRLPVPAITGVSARPGVSPRPVESLCPPCPVPSRPTMVPLRCSGLLRSLVRERLTRRFFDMVYSLSPVPREVCQRSSLVASVLHALLML